MRKLAILAIFLALPVWGQGSHWKAHDGWGLHSDKVLHLGAGATVGAAAYAITKGCGGSPKKAWVAATLSALAVGILKERYDSHKGGWRDPADAAYTGLGGFTIGWAIHMGDKKKQEFATAPKAPE